MTALYIYGAMLLLCSHIYVYPIRKRGDAHGKETEGNVGNFPPSYTATSTNFQKLLSNEYQFWHIFLLPQNKFDLSPLLGVQLFYNLTHKEVNCLP